MGILGRGNKRDLMPRNAHEISSRFDLFREFRCADFQKRNGKLFYVHSQTVFGESGCGMRILFLVGSGDLYWCLLELINSNVVIN